MRCHFSDSEHFFITYECKLIIWDYKYPKTDLLKNEGSYIDCNIVKTCKVKANYKNIIECIEMPRMISCLSVHCYILKVILHLN